jgi:hypothetical protein
MSFFEPPARPTSGFFRAKVVSPPASIAPPHNVLPGIAESRTEIDAAAILEAAGRAVTLWPDT